ncbi:hypothetical protein RRF56_04030 [Nodosilinea sp. E11]|nr:hypothetical protein [Nodosilinea sp. E11]WOD39955.1 hypothetical protein RRF56_04030 [Nodosilinea sp. E11]
MAASLYPARSRRDTVEQLGLLFNEAMMRQKLEYIHNNPVKRGYVDSPKHWRYSSARNYLGEPGLIAVDPWY